MMSLPGCCLSLATSSTTFPEMMVDSFQRASTSVVDTTYLCIRLRIGPGPSPVVCLDQPGHSISYVTRPKRYASPFEYSSVMYCILSGLFVFCHQCFIVVASKTPSRVIHAFTQSFLVVSTLSTPASSCAHIGAKSLG